MKKLLFLLGIVWFCPSALHAQDALRPRYGIFGQIVFLNHEASFQRIPGTQSCCLSYTGGSGTGIEAGALAEFPLGGVFLGGIRAGYFSQPFSMTTPENTFIIVNGVGQTGGFEHHLDGSIGLAVLEPNISANFYEHFFVSAGAQIAFPLSTNYTQTEQIASGTPGTFLNPDGSDSQSRTRNSFAGALPQPAMQISPFASLSYELPLNSRQTLLLAPEVSYHLGISNVIADVRWKINSLHAGIALKYSPSSTPEKQRFHERKEEIDTMRKTVPVLITDLAKGQETRNESSRETADAIITTETIRRTDTLFIVAAPPPSVKPKEYPISVAVSAVGVDNNGQEMSAAKLRVEEFTSTIMTPLLHYIFFAPKSADIPERYLRLSDADKKNFSAEQSNSPDKLPTYYHILNIIGKRMAQYPKAMLTLTGCTDDNADDKNNTALARQRAEAVKNYLVQEWKVAPNRIKTEARGLPEKASNTTLSDGAEENRRVEIASDAYEILAPVVSSDTIRKAQPPILRFKPVVNSDTTLASWMVEARQQNTTLKKFNGSDALPTILDWNLNEELSSIPKFEGTLNYAILARNMAGKEAQSPGSIGLELLTVKKKRLERRGDKEIDRYSLILFEVRSAELTDANKRIIQLVQKAMKPTSTVSVIGYTDNRLGTATYNQGLAESRARSTAQAIGQKAAANVQAKGNSNLYNNDLPEGRFYSRTVEIEVETPVEY